MWEPKKSRRCRNNFQLADGVLMYRTAMKPGKEEEEWRVCIQTAGLYKVVSGCLSETGIVLKAAVNQCRLN